MLTSLSSAEIHDAYLQEFARFEKNGAQPSPPWLFPLRKSGIAQFSEWGLPTIKDEDWRFTNLSAFKNQVYRVVTEDSRTHPDPDYIESLAMHELAGHRLVFVDGHYAPELSDLAGLPDDLRVAPLADALRDHPDLLEEHLTRYSRESENAFGALNTALFQDGLFIHVPRGVELTEPLLVIHLTLASESGKAVYPRSLVLLEAQSRLTLLEHHVTLGDAPALVNAVTEIRLGQGAWCEHCKYQEQNSDSFHFSGLHTHLEADSDFRTHSIVIGARLSRNDLRAKLAGKGAVGLLNGLYVPRDQQLMDHHMIVNHASSHCESHEYFNGILDDASRGVFHGRILVQPDAQKTDAKQTNKNLLLTDSATADTKPQLEIYADDVRCTHGATIGQLNPESIFYLRARGIGLEMARRMLIHGFAEEILDRIECRPAREILNRLIWDRLEQRTESAAAIEFLEPVTDSTLV